MGFWQNIRNDLPNILICIQIVFYITTGMVAVLTYKSAKKTILQPIKTEIFKEQMELFNEIMKMFNGKSEVFIQMLFGTDELININLKRLADEYSEQVLGNVIEKKYDLSKYPYMVFSNDTELDKNTLSVKNIDFNKIPKEKRALMWTEYRIKSVCLPNRQVKVQDDLKKIMKSPLLPKKCVKYIESILEISENNVNRVMDTLDIIAREMTDLFPEKENWKNYNECVFHNKLNNTIDQYESTVEKLLDYIREYLNVEELLR